MSSLNNYYVAKAREPILKCSPAKNMSRRTVTKLHDAAKRRADIANDVVELVAQQNDCDGCCQ